MAATPEFSPMLRKLFAVCAWLAVPSMLLAQSAKPNIVFILADDLGYGELGCYGQTKIKTPNLDRLAKRGMRFTQFYAGSTVCAPSRCALMTAKHTGHCTIRGNAPRVALAENELTMARFLKSLGYITSLIGKWGLGDIGTTGAPHLQGFDEYFGFLDQTHAHNSYPDYLFRNDRKVAIPDNVVDKNVATIKGVHVQELFTKEALAFIERNRKQPFFLYWAVTAPHANNERGRRDGAGIEADGDAPYTHEPWPQTMKDHAALITYLDREVGRLLDRLRELGLEENTIIVFSSDNGPHREGGGDPDFFRSSGPLRGFKRSLHDGGVRVPCLVAWPGPIAAGKTSMHIAGFQDFLPTFADLLGAKLPAGLDGISFAPTLRGQPGEQKTHEFLYWEFFEGGFQQAVRAGKWKVVRPALGAKLELYDLDADIGETMNIAARHPDIIEQMEARLKTARVDSPHFPVVGPKGKKKAIK
jgi:arylsulfatase A-like enzyme